MKSVKLQMYIKIEFQQLSLCAIDKTVSARLCFHPKIKLLKYLFGAINKHKDYKQYQLSAATHGKTARSGQLVCAVLQGCPSGAQHPREPSAPRGTHDENTLD